eukprot:GILI01028687.1.p1 GENE.GILI01028687.1~~GILI01028687.1.p1  ORF type:complete len:596 (+),score=99.12 GILI01028687.1:50-1837(+)
MVGTDAFVGIFVGVAKIFVAVVGSAIASSQIPRPKETLKDFGFIIANVLLPCLFLNQMIQAASLETIKSSYILFIAGAGAVLTGYIAATLMTRFLFPDNVKFCSIEGVMVKLAINKDIVVAKGKPLPKRMVVRVPSNVSKDEAMNALLVPSKEDLANTGYRTCVTVATILQNTFVLPMSLISSLVTGKSGSFSWINLEEVTTYIFFFNIVITIAFWTIGPVIVRGGAKLTADRQRLCEIISRHNGSKRKVSQATQSCEEETDKSAEVALAPVPYSWRDEPDRIVVVAEGEDHHEVDDSAGHSFDWEKIKANVRPLINAPLTAMAVGIVMGLIPFVRDFMLEGAGKIVFDVTILIGDGTVAASLFLLGCNLSSDFAIVASKATTFKHFSHGALLPEVGSDSDSEPVGSDSFAQAGDPVLCKSFVKGHDPMLAIEIAEEVQKEDANKAKKKQDGSSKPSLAQLFSLKGISVKLVVVSIIARLVVIPAILFIITYALIKSQAIQTIADPCGNLMLLTLLVELFSPSAINTALIFNMEQYMVREYSKVLLYQYSCAVISLMAWLTLTVELVQGDECKAANGDHVAVHAMKTAFFGFNDL